MVEINHSESKRAEVAWSVQSAFAQVLDIAREASRLLWPNSCSPAEAIVADNPSLPSSGHLGASIIA